MDTSCDTCWDTSWDASREAFHRAALDWVSLVHELGDVWTLPALGEWDVRALVGHTSRALLTVETYLQTPADAVEVASPVGYYLATRAMATGPEVTARGVTAGEALGAAPAQSVADLAHRVLELLDGCTGHELLTTMAGGMALRSYLPTRTFELTVHALDLARAVGARFEPSPSAARECLGLVGGLAVEDGTTGSLLLAVTGRGAAPGFSVL